MCTNNYSQHTHQEIEYCPRSPFVYLSLTALPLSRGNQSPDFSVNYYCLFLSLLYLELYSMYFFLVLVSFVSMWCCKIHLYSFIKFEFSLVDI